MPTLGLRSSQLNGAKRYRYMKPSSRDQQLGLASPLNCAAIQSGKTKTPSKKEQTRAGAGCKPHRLPRGEGREFSLDILFHRMSAMGILRQQAQAELFSRL
jgi:hypothetical protein